MKTRPAQALRTALIASLAAVAMAALSPAALAGGHGRHGGYHGYHGHAGYGHYAYARGSYGHSRHYRYRTPRGYYRHHRRHRHWRAGEVLGAVVAGAIITNVIADAFEPRTTVIERRVYRSDYPVDRGYYERASPCADSRLRCLMQGSLGLRFRSSAE